MSRINNWHKQFEIKELDWGINLEESPNEIDNKQWVKCLNFNFKWNKLISEAVWLNTFNRSSMILWHLVDWPDVYYITEWQWVIYKNNQLLNTNIKVIILNSVINNQFYSFNLNNWVNSWSWTYTSDNTATETEILEWLRNSFNSNTSSHYRATIVETLHNWVTKFWLAIWQWNNPSETYTISINSWPLQTIINDAWTYTASSNIVMKIYWGSILVNNNGSLYLYSKEINNWGWAVSAFDMYIPYAKTISGQFFEVYNWKLLYAKWNSLYFSKTSYVNKFFNILDFWWYDWWVQRVWEWWDITWILTSENWIYIFKHSEIYYSNSVQDDWVWFNFVVNKITNNWTSNYRTIQKINQEVFYYDWINKKVRRLWYEKDLTTLRDTSVSWIIDEIIYSIPIHNNDWSMNTYMTSIYSYPNYRLCYRTSNSLNYLNKAITYNVDRKSWTETDINVKFWWEDFYSYGNSLLRDWKKYKDWWEFLSKNYDLWDAIDYKRFSEIEIYWKKNELVDLFLDIYQEWELVQTFEINWTEFRNRYDLWNEWRFFQFWIRYEWEGYLEINQINIRFKLLKWFSIYEW